MSLVVAWSGGKDSMLGLSRLRGAGDEPLELFTTGGADTDRTSMHGVRWNLLYRQADALGLSLRRVDIPDDATNETYEETMGDLLAEYADRGVTHVAFADLFLEDVREYREDALADAPITGRWPLWGESTADVASEVIDAGFEATLVCVNDRLGPEFLGRRYDRDLLASLPSEVDPCGENGEFHTFVHDGPGFERGLDIQQGETVTRELGDTTYHYRDLTV